MVVEGWEAEVEVGCMGSRFPLEEVAAPLEVEEEEPEAEEVLAGSLADSASSQRWVDLGASSLETWSHPYFMSVYMCLKVSTDPAICIALGVLGTRKWVCIIDER